MITPVFLYCLHSSSSIVIVAVWGLLQLKVSLKVSSDSNKLSLVILTASWALVEPLLNMTEYGPEA